MQANKLVKKIINKKFENTHTSLPAKIERYDPKKMIADVVLLAKVENDEEEMEVISPILECPVAHFKAGPFIIRPPYKKGDKVKVDFSEKALDYLLITGDPEDPEIKRRFSYDDAIVTQGLKVEQEDDYPDEEPESLYIANLDKEVKMFINPDGTFRIANDQDNIQVELVMEKDGVIRITDNKNGTELKFNIENGNLVQTLSNKLLIGDSNADDAVVLLSKLLNLVSQLQDHYHIDSQGGNTTPPQTEFETDLGSQEVYLRQ